MAGEKFREELELNRARLLMSAMHDFSGYAQKSLKPTDILKLDIDGYVSGKKFEVPSFNDLRKAWQKEQQQ